VVDAEEVGVSRWTSIVLVVLLVIALGAAMFFAAPAGPVALPAVFLAFADAEVVSITVKNRTTEVVVERDASDSERWTVKSGTVPVRADSIEVEELLAQLARLIPKNVFAASEVGPQDLKNWGLEDPAARVTLGFAGRKVEAVFGGRDPQGRNVWAQKDGAPDVYLVPADPLERLEGLEVGKLRARRPLPWSAHEVKSISLKRADGAVLEASHAAAGTWDVKAPFLGSAEPVAMEAFVAKLLGLEAKEFVADGAVDPDKHGLAEPLAVISLVREGREAPVVLRISKPGEDGGARFALDGEPTVASCGPELPKAIAALDPFALRDRNLLRLGWTKLDSIEFVHPEKGWKLLRVLERWDLEKPERSEAAESEVERLLERLRTLDASEYLDSADPAALGLDSEEKAAARLVLTGLDAGGNRTLWIGKRREDGRAEVRLASAGTSKEPRAPALVPGDFVDLLESGWLHWRSREVLEVPLVEVRALSRKDASGEQSFLRESNAWKAVPGGPEPDPDALTAALTQLLHLECSAFEAKTKEGLEKWGLGDPPATASITVTLRAEHETAARTRTLVLGAKNEENGLFARMADGDLVFRLPQHRVQGATLVPVNKLLTEPWAKPAGPPK
jgi:hypothetical protein